MKDRGMARTFVSIDPLVIGLFWAGPVFYSSAHISVLAHSHVRAFPHDLDGDAEFGVATATKKTS